MSIDRTGVDRTASQSRGGVGDNYEVAEDVGCGADISGSQLELVVVQGLVPHLAVDPAYSAFSTAQILSDNRITAPVLLEALLALYTRARVTENTL
eukprot:gene36448-44954_t